MEKKRMRQVKNKGSQWGVAASITSRIALFVMLLFMLTAAVPAIAKAEETEKKSGWQFDADLYIWMSNIGLKTAEGDNIKLTFGDILEDLQLTFMGGVRARNGNWSLSTDIIYLKLEQDTDKSVTASVGPRGQEVKINADATVKLQSWIVTPAVSYSIVDTHKVRLDLLAGARYLWMKPELELDITGFRKRERTVSDSGSVWDGIVGIRGNVNLNKNWFVPYYVDIGAGDSTLTSQAMAGFGYRAGKAVDVVAAYRYLYWKFDDNKVIDKLNINGPLVGLRYRF